MYLVVGALAISYRMLSRNAIADTFPLLVGSVAPMIVDGSLTPLSAYAIIV
jgi:hypothetical protein